MICLLLLLDVYIKKGELSHIKIIHLKDERVKKIIFFIF